MSIVFVVLAALSFDLAILMALAARAEKLGHHHETLQYWLASPFLLVVSLFNLLAAIVSDGIDGSDVLTGNQDRYRATEDFLGLAT